MGFHFFYVLLTFQYLKPIEDIVKENALILFGKLVGLPSNVI